MSNSISLAQPLTKAPLPDGVKGEVGIVVDGSCKAIVVIPDRPSPTVTFAVDSFIETLRRATGVTIPIIRESDALGLPEETLRIFVGETRFARERGIIASELPEEGYRIVVNATEVIVVGRDRRSEDPHTVESVPTRWALNQLLDQYAGVRWLWPGELGTYVPQRKSLLLPAMDVTYQPDLLFRRMRLIWKWMSKEHLEEIKAPILLSDAERDDVLRESVDWLKNHQNGQRGGIRYGHAFGDWHDKYFEKHPDYFAVPPKGQAQQGAKRIKLRLANPAVVEQIAVEYLEKGKPAIYNVCPNDGYGFDTSPETRAWDLPKDQDPFDVWIGNGNLTARFVRFWNLVHERLQKENKDVTLISFAYASYRLPPPPEAPLKAKMILGLVGGFSDYEIWRGWTEAGASLLLRPNWWVVGAEAPHIPLKKMTDFLKFARANKMVGIDKDAVSGFWATQGLNYYAMARLIARPDLTKEAIVNEYASAFGPAEKQILRYISFWEEFTERAGYTNHAGTIVSENPEGLYEQYVKEHEIPFNPRLGSYWIMPHLYTDEVIAEAEAILNEGLKAVEGDREEYAQRIKFLRGGLEVLTAMRDLVAAAAVLKKDPAAEGGRQAFEDSVDHLHRLRKKYSRSHVVWGELHYVGEERLKIPTRPERLMDEAPDLRGM